MQDKFGNHKDCTPEETIKTITNVLCEIGVLPSVNYWFEFDTNCYSTSVGDLNYSTKKTTNGKGISKPYALASAYAEFVERLQNNTLHLKRYGLMPETYYDPDLKKEKKAEIIQKHQKILSYLIDKEVNLEIFLQESVDCIPYYNVNETTIEYLPNELIIRSCNSNGMCAGNNPEEAILQGICEILERYSLKTIMYNHLSVPTIPSNYIKNHKIHDIIQSFTNNGLNVIIKDCSLGGKFPVVGLIVTDYSQTKYKISFGSDPVFEVALQRCFTEIAQGKRKDNFQKKFLEFSNILDHELNEDSFLCAIRNGQGHFPLAFFAENNASHKVDLAFEKNFLGHKESLINLIRKIQNENFTIYVRDKSFLGFPTFFVYIPGMSETKKLNNDRVSNNFQVINKCLLNINNAKDNDFIACINSLEYIINSPRYAGMYTYQTNITELLFLILNDENPLASVTIEYLLALMNYYLGNYESAYHYLKSYISSNLEILSNSLYSKGCLIYFKYKSMQYDDAEIVKILKQLFPEDLSNEIYEDLYDNKKIFNYMPLPSCGNCSDCKLSHDCHYEDWKRVTFNMQKKKELQSFSQQDLSKIFITN